MKGGIQRKGVIEKMQRIKFNSMRFQTKKEVPVCDIGFNALNAESMGESMTKLKQRGNTAKILLLPLLR